MVKAEVLPLCEADIDAILPDIRQADRDEIEEALQTPMRKALADALANHCKASKIVVSGLVVAVFGDSRHSAEAGVPWLISTRHVERFPKAFLQVCKPEVAEMLTRHEVLVNYVDVRNAAAIRWLRWLGFTFGDPEPYGPLGLPFHCFWMRRQSCA
ncbi:hypothetical protein AUR59_020095 [Stutzerimonas balearica]|uniref:hypothetical protein n=1 Tax=Stutzerimonas balearica TaxID=74829 RepID=UPI000971189D|nr:hypothetical protein [Stutzerimonas balearica]OMG61465.1 hypothetical protein AUR59_020095 [Stutzerimonas balearica]